ncbi:MAG: MBL fold metallo-hydrolase [Candidatus Muiribacteriota bacterium]
MKINFYGARGSLPVSGSSFIKYGGNTTCVEVISDSGERILIDAGTGIKSIEDFYLKNEIFDIKLLLTHYHFDHIMGLPFFKPLFNKSSHIQLYGPTYNGLKPFEIIQKIINPPAFPINICNNNSCRRFDMNTLNEENIKTKDLDISIIPLNHPNGGYGYKIKENNKTFVFLTDNELGYKHAGGLSIQDYVNFSHKADLLIHDSEFLPEEYKETTGWGHSCFTQAVELALKAEVKKFGLFHHNHKRTDEGIDYILKESQKIINKNKKNKIDCIAVSQTTKIEI